MAFEGSLGEESESPESPSVPARSVSPVAVNTENTNYVLIRKDELVGCITHAYELKKTVSFLQRDVSNAYQLIKRTTENLQWCLERKGVPSSVFADAFKAGDKRAKNLYAKQPTKRISGNDHSSDSKRQRQSSGSRQEDDRCRAVEAANDATMHASHPRPSRKPLPRPMPLSCQTSSALAIMPVALAKGLSPVPKTSPVVKEQDKRFTGTTPKSNRHAKTAMQSPRRLRSMEEIVRDYWMAPKICYGHYSGAAGTVGDHLANLPLTFEALCANFADPDGQFRLASRWDQSPQSDALMRLAARSLMLQCCMKSTRTG